VDVERLRTDVANACEWTTQGLSYLQQAEVERRRLAIVVGGLVAMLEAMPLLEVERALGWMMEHQRGGALDVGRGTQILLGSASASRNELLVNAATSAMQARDTQGAVMPLADALRDNLNALGGQVNALRTAALGVADQLELIGKANAFTDATGGQAITDATTYLQSI